MKIQPFTRGPRRAIRKLNYAINALNKGVFVDSPTIQWETLPDGRQRPFLTPLGKQMLGK